MDVVGVAVAVPEAATTRGWPSEGGRLDDSDAFAFFLGNLTPRGLLSPPVSLMVYEAPRRVARGGEGGGWVPEKEKEKGNASQFSISFSFDTCLPDGKGGGATTA